MTQNIPDILGTAFRIFRIGLSSSVGALTLKFRNSTGDINLIADPTTSGEANITLRGVNGSTLAFISDVEKRTSIAVTASRAIATTDFNRYLGVNSSSQVILTVDASIFTTDAEVEITQLGTGNVLINPSSTTTLLRRFGTADSGNLTCGINSTTTITSSALFGSVNVGDLVFGTGIPAGATVTAIASTSSLTISAAATVTNASASLTFVRSHRIAGQYAAVILKQISSTEIQLIGSFA
jgi:hypothetical protein